MDFLLKELDTIAESPSHPVYQFTEIVDETIVKLKAIKPERRSPPESRFINFIQGRSYTDGSKRRSVIDAIVPGRDEICILNKHVHLKKWNAFFDEVT